jgi:preprotein translocase subunit SecB
MARILTNTPLQLDECYLTRLNVECGGTHETKESKIGPLEMTAEYNCVLQPGSEHAYQMVLSLSGRERVEPSVEKGFTFDAVIVGRYRIENASKAELEPQLARINGVSLLYSTLRGMLASATGNFQFGKIDLPSLNPIALVRDIEAARTALSTPASPKETDSSAPIERAAPTIENPKASL